MFGVLSTVVEAESPVTQRQRSEPTKAFKNQHQKYQIHHFQVYSLLSFFPCNPDSSVLTQLVTTEPLNFEIWSELLKGTTSQRQIFFSNVISQKLFIVSKSKRLFLENNFDAQFTQGQELYDSVVAIELLMGDKHRHFLTTRPLVWITIFMIHSQYLISRQMSVAMY